MLYLHMFIPHIIQAEDLNTLIGNSFRAAYAVQLHEEREIRIAEAADKELLDQREAEAEEENPYELAGGQSRQSWAENSVANGFHSTVRVS